MTVRLRISLSLCQCGIKTGTVAGMAMSLRLTDTQQEALRTRAAAEHTSMQDIALRAVDEYIERHSREDLVRGLGQRIKVDYADALRRLGE